MILNDEQKAMLNGDLGEGAAYAMKIQFAWARRLTPSVWCPSSGPTWP